MSKRWEASVGLALFALLALGAPLWVRLIGPGRRLGRSFRVKLWPTLIVFKDGQELARLVRPATAAALGEALALAD